MTVAGEEAMEANGFECSECSEVYPDQFECPHHSDECGREVVITPCANDDCDHDTHHWGLSAHVEYADD